MTPCAKLSAHSGCCRNASCGHLPPGGRHGAGNGGGEGQGALRSGKARPSSERRGKGTQDVHRAQVESGAVRAVIAGDSTVDPTDVRQPHGRLARTQAG